MRPHTEVPFDPPPRILSGGKVRSREKGSRWLFAHLVSYGETGPIPRLRLRIQRIQFRSGYTGYTRMDTHWIHWIHTGYTTLLGNCVKILQLATHSESPKLTARYTETDRRMRFGHLMHIIMWSKVQVGSIYYTCRTEAHA